MAKAKEIPFVRRFWSDLDKAKEAAKSLWKIGDHNEDVLIIEILYGLFGTKKSEYSLRLESEGQRPNSSAIVARINYDDIKSS
jgi:hypothetical protein